MRTSKPRGTKRAPLHIGGRKAGFKTFSAPMSTLKALESVSIGM